VELQDLKGRHKGETIWVLGSGSSLNFLNPRFFDDKIVVSTNFSANVFQCRANYVYTNYLDLNGELTNDNHIVVMLARHYLTGATYSEPVPDNVVLVKQGSYEPPGAQWNPLSSHPPQPDSLAYGSSSIHGAMHLAAHLGASFIVLVAADCGLIDGQINVAGYPEPTQHESFAVWNAHTILFKKWLRENYGVDVYSLNPFINLNLEGHTFSGV
jgi:hypothetical protein